MRAPACERKLRWSIFYRTHFAATGRLVAWGATLSCLHPSRALCSLGPRPPYINGCRGSFYSFCRGILNWSVVESGNTPTETCGLGEFSPAKNNIRRRKRSKPNFRRRNFRRRKISRPNSPAENIQLNCVDYEFNGVLHCLN